METLDILIIALISIQSIIGLYLGTILYGKLKKKIDAGELEEEKIPMARRLQPMGLGIFSYGIIAVIGMVLGI